MRSNGRGNGVLCIPCMPPDIKMSTPGFCGRFPKALTRWFYSTRPLARCWDATAASVSRAHQGRVPRQLSAPRSPRPKIARSCLMSSSQPLRVKGGMIVGESRTKACLSLLHTWDTLYDIELVVVGKSHSAVWDTIVHGCLSCSWVSWTAKIKYPSSLFCA